MAVRLTGDGLTVQLTSSTSRWGTTDYQKQLSQRRAQAIADPNAAAANRKVVIALIGARAVTCPES